MELVKPYYFALNQREPISEKDLIDEFIEARKSVEIKYFILDLVMSDYDINSFTGTSIEHNQENALGYVCDIILDGLPNGLPERKIKLKNLSNELYNSLKEDKHWEHLCTEFPNWSKKLIEKYSTHHLNYKWKIYDSFVDGEVKDWFRVYDEDIHSPENATKRILI